ncbi:MAG TPA: FAD-dependent oxidoreductase [Caulobacteraceae bacterium]
MAVIGAGFSGVLTAAHLLRAPDGPKVLLIERGPRFGRGAAYATASPHHQLNVRGSNMSAFPEAASHFLNWLGVDQAEGDRVFVTRDRYGQYLQSVLREAAARDASRLVFEHDAAVAIARGPRRWSITMEMGRTLAADAVVLAIGNLPPPVPAEADPALLASHRWVGDPWAWIDSGRSLEGDALLLGAGLTSVDVALSIEEQRPGSHVLALSRHGLVPRSHGPVAVRAASAPAPRGSAAEVFAQVRSQAREDWRATIDALRPHVQALWRGWSLAERQRFMRHVRPWWEVSRHRLAPEVHARLDRLRADGLFEVAAGRLQELALVRGGIEARWLPRGGGPLQSRRFSAVINCVGPLSDLGRSDDPLVCSLLRAGLARPDACRLGLDVDDASRPLSAGGTPSPGLFAVGPLTRGEVYEMTSVPDIRIQAADVAQTLLSDLAGLADAEAKACAADRLAHDLRRYLQERSDELDIEIEAKSVSRRMRGAWELRGRRAALEDVVGWLDAREAKAGR